MVEILDKNYVALGEDFLNDYLRELKPEYFKVYVYFLWKGKFDISVASDELDIDENTIEIALKFLSKKKIIKSDDEKDNCISFKKKKNELLEKEKFKEILFVAEKLTGDVLNQRMIDTLELCYVDYDFDTDLIAYLLEYCALNSDNVNANYVKSIATDWWEQGIKTIEQAKEHISKRAKKKKAIEYNTNNPILNTCNEFYNSYKVLNTEYEKAQKSKKQATDKEEKEKYNNQAVQLNGIIMKNKFDFVDNIIKEYETTTQAKKEP